MDISVTGSLACGCGMCLSSVPITLNSALLNRSHTLKVTGFNQQSLFQPCTRTNSRVRTAYTLRSPSVGRQCPDTANREPCSLNLNCFNYFYNITGNIQAVAWRCSSAEVFAGKLPTWTQPCKNPSEVNEPQNAIVVWNLWSRVQNQVSGPLCPI